jgi:hypothetical protein
MVAIIPIAANFITDSGARNLPRAIDLGFASLMFDRVNYVIDSDMFELNNSTESDIIRRANMGFNRAAMFVVYKIDISFRRQLLEWSHSGYTGDILIDLETMPAEFLPGSNYSATMSSEINSTIDVVFWTFRESS